MMNRRTRTSRLTLCTIALAAVAGCMNRQPPRVGPPAIDARAAESCRCLRRRHEGFPDRQDLDKTPCLKELLVACRAMRKAASPPGISKPASLPGNNRAWAASWCRAASPTMASRWPARWSRSCPRNSWAPKSSRAAARPTPRVSRRSGSWDSIRPGTVAGLSTAFEVTKAGENIPARYNTATVLGEEVAADNPHLVTGTKFNLEY